jgi:peroxiredoxin
MLNVGDVVPNFTLPLAFADGKKDPVEMRSLLGKGPVVIAFFPLAFTGTCTQENCELRDHAAELDRLHVTRVAFSCDTPHANVEFARKNALTHGIFSDPNHKVVNEIWDTGVAGGVASRAKRGWMVLDKNGVVVEKWVSDDPGVWSGLKPIEAALQKVKA